MQKNLLAFFPPPQLITRLETERAGQKAELSTIIRVEQPGQLRDPAGQIGPALGKSAQGSLLHQPRQKFEGG